MKVTPTPGSVAGRRIDRVGDPLDGLVNLFDLSLVLAVGLLLAALSSAGVVGLVSGGSGSGTPIAGQPSGQGETQGKGQEVGKVYRLADGSYVFAPSGATKSGASGSTAATGATPASGASGVVTPPPTAPGGATATPGGTQSFTPTQ
ncbi:MAG: hypothetical protein ACRDKI_04195 [Solirubrobacterales bacterium]